MIRLTSRITSLILPITCFLLPIILIVTSCERRPLEGEVDTGDYSDILLVTNWDKLEEEPTGMTAMFFPVEGGLPTIVISNNTVNNKIRLKQGKYRFVVFNQSITEFSSMNFLQTEKFETIHAQLESLSSGNSIQEQSLYNWVKESLNGNAEAISQVVMNPQPFNADRQTYEVTAEMCKRQYRLEQDIAHDSWGGEGLPSVVDTIYSTPLPVAPEMHITLHVKGIQNAYQTRALLTNMARSNLFGPHMNLEEKAIHAISAWKIEKDEEDNTRGTMTATFRTFGLPGMQVTKNQLQIVGVGSKPTSRGITLSTTTNNVLYIEFLLRDGTTHVVNEFDVTGNITYEEDKLLLNVDLYIDKTLPDVEDKTGAGGTGFDATVDEWVKKDTTINI